MTIQDFESLVAKGIVLLDGATGSNLRFAGMPVGVSSEAWIMDHPDIITHLQSAYVDAGSRIVIAPTFMSNRAGLSLFGLEDRLSEINHKMVALTKQALNGRAFVAGDVSPTGKVLQPAGNTSPDEVLEIYKEQISELADAGVDLITLETMLTTEEISLALEAAHAVCDLPVMCSMTVEADGHLLYGGTVWEAAEILEALGANAVGVNCSVGPDQLESTIRMLTKTVNIPVIAKPNAGLPVMDQFGVAHYNMKPEPFADHLQTLVDAGARIIGGCCGTTPEHIRALNDRFCK